MIKDIQKIFLIFTLLLFFIIFISFEGFDEFSLQNLIDYAITNNTEITQLDLDIKKAEFDLIIAKAKKFPSISFSVSLSYLTNPIGPISITAGQFGSITTSNGDILIPPEDMIIFEGMENTMYQFKMTIDQPIFTWGKIDNAIKLYELLVNAAKFKKIEKIDEIKTKIKIYYYCLFYMNNIVDAMDQQKLIVDRMVNISKQSYDNGFITYADYLQSVVAQKEFEFNYKRITSERQKIINDLKSILNFPKDKELKINYKEFENKLDSSKIKFFSIPSNLWDLALQNNLQLKQLEIFKLVVEKQYEIISSSNYLKPDIGIRIEISYYGPRFPIIETGWFTADDYNITISLGLSAPIYDAGSLEAKIKQAKNELAKVLVQIEYAYQNLSNILIQMQLKCEVNKAKIEYYLSKIQADNEIIKLKENVFNEGELNEVDFLKFKLNLYTDLISLYLEAIDYYTNYFSIEAICGVELN